jgi:NADPH:quinone reductase-like Zn-dependent oxidoreductase
VKGWQEGDRVSPVHGSFQEKGNGSWAEYCLVESSELVKAPKNLPDEQIGGLWLPYVTAWHGLHHLGNIGDSLVVAIPAASSSVGLAALEICHLIGATAIATTRTPDKVDAICDATKLPKERVIVTDEEKLKDGVKRILGPGGKVDVFFDPIGGDFLQEELECIQRGGTIILYGGLGGRGNILTGVIVMKEVRVLGYHLGMLRRDLDLSNPDNTYAVLVRHFEQKNLKPLPAATFQFIEASAALESLALNKHIGKVYLTF